MAEQNPREERWLILLVGLLVGSIGLAYTLEPHIIAVLIGAYGAGVGVASRGARLDMKRTRRS